MRQSGWIMYPLNLLRFFPHITNFFNFCFIHDIFPADWKVSKIIPLPKISYLSDSSDYHPIAILPCLSKAFEVCMCSQMVEHLMLNKLLDPFQSGFKANHSTMTALLTVGDDLSRAADIKCGSVLTLLDFSKALDSIYHELLLMKFFFIRDFNDWSVSDGSKSVCLR
jgi:hypothetical protein